MEEDVVDEDDERPVDAAGRDRGVLQRSGRFEIQVVAVERYVQCPAGTGHPGKFRDLVSQPGGKVDAAGRDAEQDDGRRVLAVQRSLLDDLMGDAGNRSADVLCGHQFPVGVAAGFPVGAASVAAQDQTSFSASRDGSLKDVASRQRSTRLERPFQ